MTSKVIALVTCERCGQVGQTKAKPYSEDWGDGHRHTGFSIDEIETWKGFIRYEKEWFAIGVKRVVPGHTLDWYPGEGDDEVDIRIDLCPTCRMSFLTWWLEGKR